MKFLRNSFLVFVFVSCTSYPKKNGFDELASRQDTIVNPYFSDTSKDYIYKAYINAFDAAFGGILIVKKIGPIHHRIVFTTEIGSKIFDFTFDRDEFIVNYILKEIDKKLLINILRNDFKVLVTEKSPLVRSFIQDGDQLFESKSFGKKHFYLNQNKQLQRITKIKNGKSTVEFLFSEINDELAKRIEINHNNLKLSIHLRSI